MEESGWVIPELKFPDSIRSLPKGIRNYGAVWLKMPSKTMVIAVDSEYLRKVPGAFARSLLMGIWEEEELQDHTIYMLEKNRHGFSYKFNLILGFSYKGLSDKDIQDCLQAPWTSEFPDVLRRQGR